MSLFNELKRRNVFRVGIAYLIGARMRMRFDKRRISNNMYVNTLWTTGWPTVFHNNAGHLAKRILSVIDIAKKLVGDTWPRPASRPGTGLTFSRGDALFADRVKPFLPITGGHASYGGFHENL